jgi:transcription initiation factor TFIIB
MDLDQIWEICDTLRGSAAEEPHVPYAEFFCICGGRKSFNIENLPSGTMYSLPVCEECGRVDDEFISDEPEWTSGADEGPDPSRVGAPTNLDHFSAAWNSGTIMKVQNGGSGALKRLARIDRNHSMNHRDRSLFHAYADLDRIGQTVLGLPPTVMYAVKIKYRKFNENVLTRGAVRNGIKANCIFQACREHNISRTTQEIADAFGIPQRDLSRTFDIFQEQIPETEVHVTTPADLIARFFTQVTCVPEAECGRVRMKIKNTCTTLNDNVDLMGRTPKAIACAVMFVILTRLNYKITKPEICKICDVSGPTLNKIENIVRAAILKQET